MSEVKKQIAWYEKQNTLINGFIFAYAKPMDRKEMFT